MKTIAELRSALEAAVGAMESALRNIENPQEGADTAALQRAFSDAETTHAEARSAYGRAVAVQEARAAIPPEATPAPEAEHVAGDGLEVRMPAALGSGEKRVRVYDTYAEDGTRSSRSIFSDMYRARTQYDSAAGERLSEHMREMTSPEVLRNLSAEQRAAITQTAGEGGELIAPVYLQDKWIGLPRASRPIANTFNDQPWQDTNLYKIPKVKTGTTVAVQTDTGSVSSTAITTELVEAAVQAIAGQQDVSQQLVDLSTPGVDGVIFDDLTRNYDTQLDVKLIEGTVTNAKGINQVAGTTAVTFTQTTPSMKEFYKKLAKAIGEVNNSLFLPPNVIAMTPLRWAWILAQVDANERPLVVPVGQPGYNVTALQDRVAAENLVGQIMGLPVVIDASIPQTKGAGTNQDEVYVYRSEELFKWESTPTLRIFPEVLSAKLEVRFQLYGYYAAMCGRLPKAISKIEGTGLVAPTF